MSGAVNPVEGAGAATTIKVRSPNDAMKVTSDASAPQSVGVKSSSTSLIAWLFT